MSFHTYLDVPDTIIESDSVREIVEHHCNHPSIEFINKSKESMDMFDLVSNDDVLKKPKSPNTTKATCHDNIPPNMIILVACWLSSRITLLENSCISGATFPDLLKRAEVTPVFKKDDPRKAQENRVYSNCSPVSTARCF